MRQTIHAVARTLALPRPESERQIRSAVRLPGLGLPVLAVAGLAFAGPPAPVWPHVPVLLIAAGSVAGLWFAFQRPAASTAPARPGAPEADVRQLSVDRFADALPSLIWALTPAGRPCYVNRSLCEWTGVPARRIATESRDALAAEVCTTLHPDDRERVMSALALSIQTGRPFSLRYRQRRIAGDHRWIESRMEPDRGEDGAIRRWYGVARDIDDEVGRQAELAAARGQLSDAQHMAGLSELSAAVAHELNQPLTAILGDAGAGQRWLDRSPPDLDRIRRILQRIAIQAETAAQILRKTAALYRQEADDRRLTRLDDILGEAARSLSDDLATRGVALSVHSPDDLPALEVDALQIRQVLANLLRNGAEAMSDTPPGARRLELRVERLDSGVLVEVADEGAGIDDAGRLFDPFFTTKPGGVGMGLAICRSIVEAHGGRIWAEPNRPRGARFRFSLPFTPHGGRS